MIDVQYRCKRLAETASPASLCVHQQCWHPTTMDLEMPNLSIICIIWSSPMNRVKHVHWVLLKHIQLSTHTYIHTTHTCIYIRRQVKNYPHFSIFHFIYKTVGLNKYVIFLHILLPFRCTWSSGPQACVFLPIRRFLVR
jgi:hypothetical protein